MDAIRIIHQVYGPGFFLRLLPEAGQARVLFDIDADVARRVLVRELRPETLSERVARNDAALADMMGRDPRTVQP